MARLKFLSLPLEVRHEIYSYLLVMDFPLDIPLHSIHTRFINNPTIFEEYRHLAILAPNYSIPEVSAEARAYFLTHNFFDLYGDREIRYIVKWPQPGPRQPADLSSWITRLLMRVDAGGWGALDPNARIRDMDYYGDNVENAISLKERLPQLRLLLIQCNLSSMEIRKLRNTMVYVLFTTALLKRSYVEGFRIAGGLACQVQLVFDWISFRLPYDRIWQDGHWYYNN